MSVLELWLLNNIRRSDRKRKIDILKPILISLIVFACLFGAALVGRAFRSFIPDSHLGEESRSFVITLGVEIAGVIAAFVLALLVAGAQSSFRDQRSEIIEMSAKIVFLDEILANYGPETKEARVLLRRSVVNTIDEFWLRYSTHPAELEQGATKAQVLYDKILVLSPNTESQRLLKEKALDISFNLEQLWDLLILQQVRSIPVTFLIVMGLMVFWFICIFFSLGIYAPSNSTVIFVLVLAALSVAIAFFMIIDLNLPFEGVLRMPSAPITEVLDNIGH